MKQALDNIPQTEKHVLDVVSAFAAGMAFFTEYLPTVAVFLTIIWTGLRIYETDTIQRLLGKDKNGEGTDTK